MFGYILPEKPELKVREYELFRAYYCGVCKSIGNRYGQLWRMTLNYDSAFLALLLSSISKKEYDLKTERCIAHPIKKRLAVRNSHIVDYASDMNILLVYYKMKDDWKDDRSPISGTGMLLLKDAFERIRKKYPEKCISIEKCLSQLSELEKNRCDCLDQAAEPFARLMENITTWDYLYDDEKTGRILRWIGYNIGRWIYIIDAYDDLEKDIRKKAYNPLVLHYKYDGGNVSEFRESIRNEVEFTLTYSLSEIAKAYELLDKKNDTGIVENIIYMGMLRKTENILNLGRCKKIEKSV